MWSTHFHISWPLHIFSYFVTIQYIFIFQDYSIYFHISGLFHVFSCELTIPHLSILLYSSGSILKWSFTNGSLVICRVSSQHLCHLWFLCQVLFACLVSYTICETYHPYRWLQGGLYGAIATLVDKPFPGNFTSKGTLKLRSMDFAFYRTLEI